MKQKCSNCGAENIISEEDYDSRETTLCELCNHPLSVCGGFLE